MQFIQNFVLWPKWPIIDDIIVVYYLIQDQFESFTSF